MTDQEQTDAMAAILGKMSAAADGNHVATEASAGENDAMFDVLKRLQEATDGAAYDVVTESKSTPELGVAIQAERTETGVSVSQYDIRTEKQVVQEGLKKTFYHIVDNETGETVYEDLGLFESAMGVVKHLLYTGDQNKVNRIIDLDQEYVGAVMETYGYKKKLKHLNESSTQFDVTSAKYSNSRDRISAVKMKLLKTL